MFTGCASAERVVVNGPDGPATLVTCRNYEACLEEAAEGCPFGYDVIDRGSSTRVSGFVSEGQGYIGSRSSERMLIRCRARTAGR